MFKTQEAHRRNLVIAADSSSTRFGTLNNRQDENKPISTAKPEATWFRLRPGPDALARLVVVLHEIRRKHELTVAVQPRLGLAATDMVIHE
ncbi:hypothetical protein W97_06869 [Coniosporium apollinis CBS 100218]|uniref:Uncharacterized protein n=1 Tax=Coniosporium apollinis (strain CBS 100218) TaxID=1168221 RepID=R7Z1D9_CONA1|nr:uncharacterized protein W97_06869 [Coniosporium apollinis CBS 100218]EON67726.1 hypothetical protein W97_06869 [Coniosporium apollinis CBS 100218]